ncbi:hypothetical protein QLG14_14365 [Pseudomonas sp. V104_10]|uniref:hypothetical protein n=1 Tax=Pseudomonas sp. V104_10 TaxID=3044231 RepID=UPI00249E292C|nr:hypothetical protein [Pseudomonas sp. V104_10]MDI3370419.1 hypothetical protein [Pseudomonas sp. V104_10]
MEVFQKALMDTYHAGGIEFDWPCQVRIDEDMLVIEYLYNNELCTYRGHSIGNGHYRLNAVGFRGEGTLHRFAGGLFLEGFWVEEAEQGMWRIRLVDV